MKKICLLLLITFLGLHLHADEGMWLPLLLQKNEAAMKQQGMKISAKDIYDINNACLKDAIVKFGGGCTGEFVSDKGLMFTNHHCGYGDIVSHSTVEHDYLTNGFWAANLGEELPCPNTKATLLVRMEDVTNQILKGITSKTTEADRKKIIKENTDAVIKKATEGTHYSAEILDFYYGNQYFLFVNEVFTDVRLVGAPPSNIGKFGGDTDNWMWPRHTGDFSVFRVYASKDNKPATYSKDNVPYKPKKSLTISLKGIQKDDFTFVFGYPGKTQEYLTSYAVDQTVNVLNPARIQLREKRLEIYNAAMDESADQRLRYANNVAGIANFWKKMIGESKGVLRLKGVEKKQEFEKSFTEWVNATPERKQEYGNLLSQFSEAYASLENYELSRLYLNEAFLASDLMMSTVYCSSLIIDCDNPKTADSVITKDVKRVTDFLDGVYKNYDKHRGVDRKIFVETLKIYYSKIDKKIRPTAFDVIDTKYKGNVEAFAQQIFDESVFSSPEKANKLFENFNREKAKEIKKDVAYNLFNEVKTYIDTAFAVSNHRLLLSNINLLYRTYMKGMMEMQTNKQFYPDANGTLRVAYGKVNGYEPTDAVEYKYYTTIDGIMQKENPNIYDYVVEPKLKQLYNNKDYGKYAPKSGSMPVAFIATNHTTGGNSGSPVLNGNGELIGINFDRCWEGTMSDIMYDPSQCRNIALDIRYCLFIIDKFAGAGHLVNEMKIVY